MSARRTDMHQLQEVIRLHRLGNSRRTIARQLRMGRDTIRHYMAAFAKARLLDGAAAELPDLEALQAAIPPPEGSPLPPQQISTVAPWEAKIKTLHGKGAGPTAIHDHLKLHDPDYDGSLSAVKRVCQRLTAQRGPVATDVVIRAETAPGEVAQVDFGYAGKRYDPDRGLVRKAWVFVMTLAFSRHMFADLVFDQTIGTWLRLHMDAFEFFGGAPRIIVPDNLKAAVVRAAFGVDDEVVLNRSYRELARHYGFQVDPAPPRAPQRKGKVEAAVKYVKRNFLATWESHDIHEDRRQLRRWIEQIAAHRRHGTTGQPPGELFQEQERPGHRSRSSCGRCGRLIDGDVDSATACPRCNATLAETGIWPPDRSRRSLVIAGLLWLSLALLLWAGIWALSARTPGAIAARELKLLADPEVQRFAKRFGDPQKEGLDLFLGPMSFTTPVGQAVSWQGAGVHQILPREEKLMGIMFHPRPPPGCPKMELYVELLSRTPQGGLARIRGKSPILCYLNDAQVDDTMEHGLPESLVQKLLETAGQAASSTAPSPALPGTAIIVPADEHFPVR